MFFLTYTEHFLEIFNIFYEFFFGFECFLKWILVHWNPAFPSCHWRLFRFSHFTISMHSRTWPNHACAIASSFLKIWKSSRSPTFFSLTSLGFKFGLSGEGIPKQGEKIITQEITWSRRGRPLFGQVYGSKNCLVSTGAAWTSAYPLDDNLWGANRCGHYVPKP